MNLPFSAVVGQDDAKLALILAACDPLIGGVLLRGDKGSAKSTLARGLARLLPGDAPFVELPIGSTEDRLVGTLDIAAALTGGEKRFEPGLLHAAHGGVLYVDEVNLLPDHLVDVLLDVAASGVNRVEREGISHSHPSRFVLVGSMNPEEGDLRPQLLDRFGLAVEVRSATDPAGRAAALHRRLAFDADPGAVTAQFGAEDARLAACLRRAKPAGLPEGLVESVAALCASVGAEGLRADLTICRAASALAAWEGRPLAGPDDVRRVAPLALAHRARRDPLDPAGFDRPQLEGALDEHMGPRAPDENTGPGAPDENTGPGAPDEDTGPGAADENTAQGGPDERVADPARVSAPEVPAAAGRASGWAATGRRSPAPATRGRLVGDRAPDGAPTSVAVAATVRHAAARGRSVVEPSDVREAVREQRAANLIVITVDASGSMGARERMEAAKGAVVSLLRDAYQKRDRVALVAFRGGQADVLLKPTGSVEVARARLAELPTGGLTPLAAGLDAALRLAAAPGPYSPVIVVVTDGRATPGADAIEAARTAALRIRRAGITSVVVDTEPLRAGPSLGLAVRLAESMGAAHVALSDLNAGAVEDAVRSVAG